MKKILLAVLFLSIFIFNYAKIVSITENKGKPLFQTINSDEDKTVLEFNLDKYQIEDEKINNVIYKKIELNHLSGEQYENGKPYIPSIGGFVAIPNDCDAELEILSYESEEMQNIVLFPRQPDENNKAEFTINDAFYAKDIEYPASIATIGKPVILRDYRLVALNITPFQYNPAKKTLKIFKNVKVKIKYKNNKNSENVKTINKKPSRFFDKIYKNIILNYDYAKNRDEDYQQPTMLVIYANSSSLQQMVNVYVEWKRQKGFDVIAVSTGETGSSFNSIKSYIQNAYDNWENRPEYLVLIGDASSGGYNIPTHSFNGGAGDIAYTLLEGNDILGDMFVGRLSVSTQSEMATVLNKILKYEKEPYMTNTDWYKKAVLVGDPSSSGPSTIYTNKYIKQVILNTNPDYSFYEAYNGSYTSTMSNAVNDGVLYFNYRGYWGMSGWQNSNTNSLHNGYKLPMVVAITCGTGDFDDNWEDSINEVFLTAGTATNPKGGIAAVSTATIHTHTCFNNIVDAGIYYAIFQEGITSPGAALTRAKYAMYVAYPQNPSQHVTEFSYWNNLMGDPTIDLWTNEPQNFEMDFPQSVPFGTKNISVTCYDNDRQPLKDVWVTAYKAGNQIFATGFTDENGKVLLNVNAQINGNFTLTATKHNYIPKIENINVVSQPQNLVMEEFDIDDQNGNNDGNINPGEEINLNIHLKNYGTNTATNVSATISSDSDLVSIANSSVTYPDINTMQTAESDNDFVIHFNTNIKDGEKIPFQIVISNGDDTHLDYFVLEIKSKVFVVQNYQLQDDNNNSYLDPNETAQLSVSIKNLGSITAYNVHGELISNSSKITVNDAEGSFGSINPNQVGNNNADTFSITADENLIPGTIISLQLNLSDNDNFDQTVYVNIQIGNPGLTDPVGPDEFGHFIYDDGDLGYDNRPQYQWIEIDPSEGGGGTILSMSDNGGASDVEVVDLPIEFRFYGKEYNSLTICSDGWISPGNHDQPEFMNWPLPGPLAPEPLIAVFWDDFKKSGSNSKILYKHNSATNTFIVEWKNLKQNQSNSNEIFQVILYDANEYPTSTMDSKIKFQYKEVHNVNGGNYGGSMVVHGQYATVGIQNEDATVGLQYTYNNTYPTPAKHLTNEMALMISGGMVSFVEPFITMGDVSYDDNRNHNNQADFGEFVKMYIKLKNFGENTATGVSATVSTQDQYVTLHNDFSNYDSIESYQEITNSNPFTFDVAQNVPDGHLATFEVTVNSDQDSWHYSVNVKLNSISLSMGSCRIANDTNDDGLLEPGESADIITFVYNEGGAPETNLHLTISSTSNLITFENTEFNISHIYGNSQFAAVYHATISSSASENENIPISLNIIGDNGFSTTLNGSVRVGPSIEDFETGDFSRFDWEFPDQPWQITSNVHHAGNYSAVSADIDDMEQTTLKIQVNLQTASQVSFYRKVSCEDDGNNGYDRLEFWIDNTEMQRWGGEKNWAQFTYSVPAGQHTLRWIYRKDTYVSSGQDCAWVDDIQFPGGSGILTQPLMMISYTSVNEILATNQTIIDTIDITNIGGGVLTYNASIQNSSDDFLTIENTSASLETGETSHLILHISSENLELGEYHAQIFIDDNRSQTVIPVTLTVEEVENSSDQIPLANYLYQSYPNPFYPNRQKAGVSIKFALKKSSKVALDIFNIKGQKVKTLIDDNLKSGIHKIVWNGKDNYGKRVSSGVYFYRIKTSDYRKIQKMVLIK